MAFISKKTTTYLFTAFLLFVLMYVLFSARHMLMGPQVNFGSIPNPYTTDIQVIELQGRAQNTDALTMNNRPIAISPEGIFTERILLTVGENVFTFHAVDRFGRSSDTTLAVVYEPSQENVIQLKTDINTLNDTYGNEEGSE